MPPQRSRSNSSNGSAGKPRLFQCTGYGDCHMVFTRSEHLARHARKHTGEKPFKCIVPECNKMFSRFDNMMQHTQTHRAAPGNSIAAAAATTTTMATTTPTTAATAVTAAGFLSTSSPLPMFSPHPTTPFARQRRARSSTTGSLDHRYHRMHMPPVPLANNTHEGTHSHRRLSIADLCNPPVNEERKEHHSDKKVTASAVLMVGQNVKLTADELEVLQAFGRLSTTPDYFDSLRDLFTDSACVCL
ncbi:hypothetical protein BX666DRAFT_1970606 [Dichotomocladium elegans]|nr:hypothetical protein BX666DRAFT_1970606 [Dichotomocladium elegans]